MDQTGPQDKTLGCVTLTNTFRVPSPTNLLSVRWGRNSGDYSVLKVSLSMEQVGAGVGFRKSGVSTLENHNSTNITSTFKPS